MTKGSTEPVRRSLLDRLFRHEEINGGNRCPTYLHRWTLLKLPFGVSLYLHKFVRNDWCLDLHDHPKRFISLGLRGTYLELTPNPLIGDRLTLRRYDAPWLRTFPASYRHRLMLPAGGRPCWTLVVTLWQTREWGFWHQGEWLPWYRYLKTSHADERKDC